MKHLLRLSLALVAAMSAAWAWADIPAGYYNSLNGKTGAELKAAARAVIYPHTEVSSYTALPEYFRTTDVYPDYTDYQGNLRWWEMYSNMILTTPAPPQPWRFTGLNREHSFPKSWWGGSDATPAYTDLNHLYPSEAKANMAKSNYPLGKVMTPTFDNGVTAVGYPVYGQGGGAAQVFEPANEYKGDFARTYFYVVTCYSNLSWNTKYMFMLQQNEYPTLQPWAIDLLLQWAREDPVSQKEIQRNDKVYGFQNNRNPFIDFPELCEYIWGNKVGEPFDIGQTGGPTGDVNLITPTQGMALDFGEVAVGSTQEAKLYFKGENCVGSFTLTLSGADKSMFAIDYRSISASIVNSASGYWLTVKYKPTAEGEHRAKLIVSDGGLTGSRGIELIGQCLPVPTLTALTATEPSDITADSYVANWDEAAAGEVVDYYIVTRTRYIDGSAYAEELEAESNMLEITDFAASDRETYSVQSVRLGYRSPMSNTVTVEHSGISGVTDDAALAVMSYPGCIRFVCAEDNTGCRIYDLSGRLVMLIPVITNNMEITLPAGVYVIVTDQRHTPMKAVAY